MGKLGRIMRNVGTVSTDHVSEGDLCLVHMLLHEI